MFIFVKYFKDFKEEDKFELLLELGSVLVGDVMRFVLKVESIKNVRGKYIVILLGSMYNINFILNKKNFLLEIYVNKNEKVIK